MDSTKIQFKLSILLLLAFFSLLLIACRGRQGTEGDGSASKIDSLEHQLKQLMEKSKEATVVRRVSEQLEEIAYQQKDISDAQRVEALFQKKEAEQMRSLAELENERAQTARQEALAAYSQMEEQKKMADARREEAVNARLKTDTLARLALGRSLATEAVSLNWSNNSELADLLAFSGWTFTKEYNGDIYQSAIFDALNEVSGSALSLTEHRGAVRDICVIENSDNTISLVSVSQWGEVIWWRKNKGRFEPHLLFENDRYDFRHVCYSKELKKLIVASYKAELVVFSGDEFQTSVVIPTDSDGLVGLDLIGSEAYFVTKEGTVCSLNIAVDTRGGKRLLSDQLELKPLYSHPLPISCQLAVGNEIWLGDESGTITKIDLKGELLSSLQIRKMSPLTAIGVDTLKGLCAYGFKDGAIKLVSGEDSQDKFGHLSQINGLVFNEEGLISVSNDCTIRFWPRYSEPNRSLVVSTSSSWIYSVTPIDDGRSVVSGGASNLVQITPVSPFTMAKMIQDSLAREFTLQEWNYYIGEVAPYRTFK